MATVGLVVDEGEDVTPGAGRHGNVLHVGPWGSVVTYSIVFPDVVV